MFIYGAPGNGKTSIAERLTATYGDTVWIPRAIDCDGEIIRVYDPCVHHAIPINQVGDDEKLRQIDHRWVCITRPTVVVGGELTMEHLEVQPNRAGNFGSTAAAQEQLWDTRDRRFWSAADLGRPIAESVDRALGETVRLPELAQRQKAASAVRSAGRLFHES